ncbi:MAG: hypothetical protein AB1758_05115 [Candidatus Eremiobacterota bacterium]
MFGWIFRKQTPAQPQPSMHTRMLGRIQTILARRPGQSDPIRLMTDRMSPRRVPFRTGEDLREGEHLVLSLLLNHRTLLVPARVDSCVRECGVTLGQLVLHVTEEEMLDVAAYLELLVCRSNRAA